MVPEAGVICAVLVALSKRLVADAHVLLPFLAVRVLFDKFWLG